MADIADMAQDIIEADMKRSLKNIVGEGFIPARTQQTIICEDCGDSIPKARRKAVPGCIRCVACQTDFERMRHKYDDDEAA